MLLKNKGLKLDIIEYLKHPLDKKLLLSLSKMLSLRPKKFVRTTESIFKQLELRQNLENDEVLFVGTAEAEHVEMYLKAIWHIKERNDPVKISTIAKMLNVRQPSVVQMLKKLNEK